MLWKSRKPEEEFRYFFGRALITPGPSYESDFDNSSLDDLYLNQIKQPISPSLRLESKDLKKAKYVILPSPVG